MDLDDLDDRRRLIALFRHGVIAELDVGKMSRGEISERVGLLASQVFVLPSGQERSFSVRTLWSWWSAYRKQGLEGLLPAVRSDRGTPRVIVPELLAAAIGHRNEIPSRSTKTLIDILERQGVAPPGQLRRATLDRHLERAGASRRRMKTLGAKRFIRLLFERPNDFWVGDYHEAPILYDPRTDSFRTIHLCAWIDHYSKVVPHAQWYRNERIATLEDALKKACLKRGLPISTYVDNGSVYRSADFAFATAHLGIKSRRSKAYQSEGRGAIERWNRTVVEQFEAEARAAQIDDLERLNLLFEAWLEERYHRAIHEATNQAPLDRFMAADFVPKYPDPVLLADTFRVRVKRRVHPKTSTVQVGDVHFVVETFLRGRWVRVHYDPHQLDDVLIYFQSRRVQRAFVQQPNEPPQPLPERAAISKPSFDYLGALRADYDRRVVAEARKISLSAFTPSEDFSLPRFFEVCAQLLGKDLSPYERDDLERGFRTVGPFSEPTTRLALEHALKLRGRGLHVSVYTHYLKVFHLEAIRALGEPPRKGRP